jgi:hypothetical protein
MEAFIEGERKYGTVQARVYTSPKTLLSSKPAGRIPVYNLLQKRSPMSKKIY